MSGGQSTLRRIRRLAAKRRELALVDALDSRPVRVARGGVAVGREVVGWRDAKWEGGNIVDSFTVIIGSLSAGYGATLATGGIVWGPVELARYAMIGPGAALIAQSDHPVQTAAIFSGRALLDGRRKALAREPGATDEPVPMRIGNDVWIGHRATIMGPITVGDGAIIGAGAVVSSDVAPFTIVAGVPARLIRPRFAPPVIDRLQRLAWWELSPRQLEAFEDVLAADLTGDVDVACSILDAAIARRPEPAPLDTPDPAPERFSAGRRWLRTGR